MEWALGILVFFVLLIAYTIVQETRAQLHWRGLVEKGDVDAVRKILETEVERWRSERVPRGVPASLWHGVQTVELVDVSATSARLNCSAEGEHAFVGGRQVETTSPLGEGMKITMKLADMLLYDVPNLKLARVQLDVYTSFRDEQGHSSPRCILSTIVRRDDVEDLDWEATDPAEFVEVAGGRFAADESGAPHPIDPLAWSEEAERTER